MDPVGAGSNVVYTATITNYGPLDSLDVHVNATLPSGIFFDSISCDGGCAATIINGSISVALGDVPAGVDRHVYVTAEVSSIGTFTVTASVDSSGTTDPEQSNNSASYTTTGVAPTPTPTPTFTPTPTPTPTATPTMLANISTRVGVENGDNVLIGGLIITGTQAKKVIIRAIGPSLPLAGNLQDPTLELFGPSGPITSNDNWKDTQEQEITDTKLAPSNDLDSAIVATLNPGAYTAIVRGNNNGAGIALIEAYDLDQTVNSQLANISTRGFVQTSDNVMIGGFILNGDGAATIVVRAIGPSLTAFGVAGALQDPTLDLFDGSGVLVASDDNWKETQQTAIIATGLQPSNDLESAIVATLPAGAYTAIVRGNNSTTGVGLVEVYHSN